jgi:hypothetical protein
MRWLNDEALDELLRAPLAQITRTGPDSSNGT